MTSVVAMRAPMSANLRWLWLAALVIAVDQLTKHLIVAWFRPGEEWGLTPFASLILAFNRGAAFSFLAGETGWQRWLFAAIAIAACAVMAWLLARGGRPLFCAGLALIIGGALGNLIDRAVYGHVIDYILFHTPVWSFAVFNLADAFISVGAALVVFDELIGWGREAKPQDPGN
jgi:signal peptidase II